MINNIQMQNTNKKQCLLVTMIIIMHYNGEGVKSKCENGVRKREGSVKPQNYAI